MQNLSRTAWSNSTLKVAYFKVAKSVAAESESILASAVPDLTVRGFSLKVSGILQKVPRKSQICMH